MTFRRFFTSCPLTCLKLLTLLKKFEFDRKILINNHHNICVGREHNNIISIISIALQHNARLLSKSKNNMKRK